MKCWLTVIAALCLCPAIGQDLPEDSLSLEEQWALLEAELDQEVLMSTLDSLMKLDLKVPSEFNVRMSYNSNILNAGRNYGVDQHSLSPGISYYHKSGFYGDVSGYWSSQGDPKYNLTVLSAGYLDMVNVKWSYGFSYEHWIYNETETFFENNLGANTIYRMGNLSLGVDYSFLFGAESAHRFIGGLSYEFAFEDVLGFDKIRINPTVSGIIGNDIITTFNTSNFDRLSQLRLNWFDLTLQQRRRELLSFLDDNPDIDRTTLQELLRVVNAIAQGRELTPEQEGLIDEFLLVVDNSKEFGFLNYSFTLPITLSTKHYFVMLAYSYSVPLELSEEAIDLEPIGYFSISFNYRLFKK